VLPGIDFLRNFHDTCAMLRAPLVAQLREADPRRAASFLIPATRGLVRELGVPRLALETFCAFSSFCVR
jgi:hypothetical protein